MTQPTAKAYVIANQAISNVLREYADTEYLIKSTATNLIAGSGFARRLMQFRGFDSFTVSDNFETLQTFVNESNNNNLDLTTLDRCLFDIASQVRLLISDYPRLVSDNHHYQSYFQIGLIRAGYVLLYHCQGISEDSDRQIRYTLDRIAQSKLTEQINNC